MKKENGFVMLGVLMLLPVLIFVTTAIIRDVGNNKKVVNGVMAKQRVTQQAKSGIGAIWTVKGLLSAGGKPGEAREIDLDSEFHGVKGDVLSHVSVGVCYEGLMPVQMGVSMDSSLDSNYKKVSNHYFKVRGRASGVGIGAESVIERGGYVVRPGNIGKKNC